MTTPRILLISLGNPKPYYRTLHSAGHHILNALPNLIGASQPPFSQQRYGAKLALASVGPQYTMIQSPVLMNISGPWLWKAVAEVVGEGDPKDWGFVLIHDELELELGEVKRRKWKASHKGHNGVKSVLGASRQARYNDLICERISVGISRPESRDQSTVSDYVLSAMTRQQESVLRDGSAPQVLDVLLGLESTWQ